MSRNKNIFLHLAIPLALPDKPIISKMSDRRLTLSWKPSLPIGPSVPVTYIVDMCEVPNGEWFVARSGKLYMYVNQRTDDSPKSKMYCI